jgi:hypothetical protein
MHGQQIIKNKTYLCFHVKFSIFIIIIIIIIIAIEFSLGGSSP